MTRKLCTVALAVAIASSAFGADRGPSTPQERQRLLKAAELIQKQPLSPEASKEGQWALPWIEAVPDINVTTCGSFSPGYRYEGRMMASFVISMAAFLIQNPKQTADQKAVWRAGIEGLLSTYKAILAKHPEAHDDFYDDLVQERADDNLKKFMDDFASHCGGGGTKT